MEKGPSGRSRKNCLTNVMNAHTCTVGRVDTLLALVGLPHLHLLEFSSHVVGGAGVHIPARINREGRRLPLRSIDVIGHCQLTVQEASVVVNTKEAFVEAFEAPRGNVSRGV